MLSSYLTGFLADMTWGIVGESAFQYVVTQLKKGGKPVNHDLEKAVKRSFLSALQIITMACHEELTGDFPQRFTLYAGKKSASLTAKGFFRKIAGIAKGISDISSEKFGVDKARVSFVYPEDHQDTLEWLDRKYRRLAAELGRVREQELAEGPLETVREIEALLKPEGLSAEEAIRRAEESLISEALKDADAPECYKEKVRAEIFDRTRDYFISEIKREPNVRHIFDSHLLTQISMHLSDMMKKQAGDALTLARIEERLRRIEDLLSSSPISTLRVELKSDFNALSISQLWAIVNELMQKIAEKKMEMLRLESGSVVLVFEGPSEACERGQRMFNKGKILEIQGISVKSVTVEPVVLSKSDAADALAIVKNALKKLFSEFIWTPQWAGQLDLVVAADIPKQTHIFELEDGKADIKCHWGRRRGKKTAFIHISWTISVSTDQEVKLLFVNPETDPPEIRREYSLRTIRMGDRTFTSNDLGFDPATERWGIAVSCG